jgi:hypothetical protein
VAGNMRVFQLRVQLRAIAMRDKERDAEKQQQKQQSWEQMRREEMDKVIEFDKLGRADPVNSICARIYKPGYDEVIGTVLPSGNQWNIHSLLSDCLDGRLASAHRLLSIRYLECCGRSASWVCDL